MCLSRHTAIVVTDAEAVIGKEKRARYSPWRTKTIRTSNPKRGLRATYPKSGLPTRRAGYLPEERVTRRAGYPKSGLPKERATQRAGYPKSGLPTRRAGYLPEERATYPKSGLPTRRAGYLPGEWALPGPFRVLKVSIQKKTKLSSCCRTCQSCRDSIW